MTSKQLHCVNIEKTRNILDNDQYFEGKKNPNPLKKTKKTPLPTTLIRIGKISLFEAPICCEVILN